MNGCKTEFMPIVNAEFDSMGGVIDPGVGISSKPSLQQSSDLEKTQAELRQTFTAAEKFRRELEFLQKGGDPLDLKPVNAASISFQSTSLTNQHLTSEAKGSFAITASPHGDSVESSGRLGGVPSVCEPNSADNLMLFDGAKSKLDITRHVSKESGDSAVLELPKKSYKRRIRSRPNRDGARSKPKSPSEVLDDLPAGQSTILGPPHGPHSENLVGPTNQENHQEQVALSPKCPIIPDTDKSENLVGPTNGFGNMEEVKDVIQIPTKVLDSESSCGQSQSQSQTVGQHCEGYNGNINNNNGLGSKEVVVDVEEEKDDDKLMNIEKEKKDDNVGIKEEEEEEGLNELKNSVCTTSEPETKPQGLIDNADLSEKNESSQGDLALATKELEDSILEEARIIEAKRKRIAELSVRSMPLEKRVKSQWDFVLEEMSWLANDFAQERLWKIAASAQISKTAAFSSIKRYQKQNSLQKQKEVAHTLSDAVMQFWNTIQVKKEESETQVTKDDGVIGIQGYAMRFLEYNNSKALTQYKSSQPPLTLTQELGIMDLSWEDNLTEENLFYTVPPGAIEAYRKAIESHLLQFERTGTSMQEEVDTSGYDAVSENTFEEDEGERETNTYYLPGVYEGGHKSINMKAAQKRRKNFKFDRGRIPYDADVAYGGTHIQNQNQPSILSGKRPATSLNVSIPTKRMRTASRQRIISPYNHAGTSGCVQTPPHRTDASSGDTNSFQDEQSSLHGSGSHMVGNNNNNNMEAESVGDYEKQLQFDSMEVSNRPKKKKKIKHPGSAYDHRWQLESNFQNDQKDHSRRRLDTHQFDSNGSSVASQMSNMSNPNKIMKLLARDRGRKTKSVKTPIGQQPGSGSPWSLFEDQALVVLVHDMGPNWELISDAINSTLQFKCIFRKSKECKERHKILMDRNTGDGADSAEDSGSSQPYPSTLPGIPEGSARQLFQRLQGPMEEDTLKSHFEKIIMIGHKQHYRRTHNDNQDPKQLQQPHSSHSFALSQVVPNNLNGGPVLTPLELSEPISTSQDVIPGGFQGPGGLPVLNHGTVPPPIGHGTSLPSASSPLNPAVREGRYGIPRSGPLSVDDQQKMQQYNQMLSARNTNQSGLPPGSHSVGVRMLPAGSGMGVMCGMTRGIKMARPPSPSMLNSSNMLTSGTPTSTSGQSQSQGQGNSMMRSRDPVHMRPNQNTVTDVPIQQASSSSQTLPPVPSHPLHRPISPQQSPRVLNPHHPHHFPGPPNLSTTSNNPQHPAFAMRFAKERQLQQQRLRQQQQFPTSNQIMPPVQQPPPHVPHVAKPQRPRNQFPKGGSGVTMSDVNGSSKSQSQTISLKQQKGGLDNTNIANNKLLMNQKQTVNPAQKLLINRKVNTMTASSETRVGENNNSVMMSSPLPESEQVDSVQWQQQQKPPS